MRINLLCGIRIKKNKEGNVLLNGGLREIREKRREPKKIHMISFEKKLVVPSYSLVVRNSV